MISAWDDFPVHQTSQPVRFVGTSDRNFYDRYYFNLHASSDELFMIMGMGQYPNLAVQDAFACVRRGEKQYVVRASKELGDRMDLGVGPFGIEVVKPLEELRFVLEENEHGIAGDLHWRGSIPAVEEQNQFLRRHGRVFFDTSRLAQTGTWEGWLRVGDERFEVTPDRWWGTRDRSWGVRPHGEPEPEGIHAGGPGSLNGMWNYFPMQFADHSILYIRNEENDGTLALHESRRIWRDSERPIEELGPVEYEHHLEPGTRMMTGLPRGPRRPLGGEMRAPYPHLHRHRDRLHPPRARLASRDVPGPPGRPGPRVRSRGHRNPGPAHPGRPLRSLQLPGQRGLRPLRARLHRPLRE
ncbi:MAG: hypothetical protein JRH19_24950, partial [Deltaproteobacteria bacterium]|nr:hypothetical protein [Deltaproteobacteria bacterium]